MTSQVDRPDIAQPKLATTEPMEPIYRGAVAIKTQGCKLNQADSDLLARRFAEEGYRLVKSVTKADVFVLNTCTVTANADAKARQALRAAHRANPQAIIVATGCYAQRSSDALARVDGVSLVAGNSDKERLPSMVTSLLDHKGPQINAQKDPQTAAQTNPLDVSEAAGDPDTYAADLVLTAGRNRAMVKIQEGCNQICAYCIVPKVRGRERSIHPDSLVEQINERVDQGYREVVLTGTQLGTYGFDIPGATLTRLLERVLAETAVDRLRVSSLQPQEIGPELLELWQDPRMCRHFHIPLQSGNDLILRRMRRRYTTGLFANTVELVRRSVPGCGITADLIVGFPGENEPEFQESRSFAQAMEFSDMHIFPYSARPGTTAAHFADETGPAEKKARAVQMLAVAKEGFRSFRMEQLGQTKSVLWESVRGGSGVPRWSGLTDNYIRVYTHGERDLRNTITAVQLGELNGEEVSVQIV